MAEGHEVEHLCNEPDNVPPTGQQDQQSGGEKGDSMLLQLGESLTQLAAEEEPGSYVDSLGRHGVRPHDGASYDWTLPGTGAELEALLAAAYAAGVSAQASAQGSEATTGSRVTPQGGQAPSAEGPLIPEICSNEEGEDEGEGTPEGVEVPPKTILDAAKRVADQATQVVEPGQKCVILQGIPASGKSTWAKALVVADPTWKRVNKDDIRESVHSGIWSKENEKVTQAIHTSTIMNLLERGFNVVLDDTNLEPKVLRKLRGEISQMFPGVGWKLIRFDIPLMEALRRNALRSGSARVPDHVVRRMWIKYCNYTPEL